MSEHWRPDSAAEVPLSDLDLAKLGLLAQLEAQCKGFLLMALKGLEQLDADAWARLEPMQFAQLCARLTKAADGVDAELSELVATVSGLHAEALSLRHKNLHSVWARHGGDPSRRIALDLRRNEKLAVEDLDSSLTKLAKLTHDCQACAYRVAVLIKNGSIPEGTSERGPNMNVMGTWVRF